MWIMIHPCVFILFDGLKFHYIDKDWIPNFFLKIQALNLQITLNNTILKKL